MRSGFFTILKKELARFFGDKRMVFCTILLPGLLIYIMYSFMGSALLQNFSGDKEALPQIAVLHLPASLEEGLSAVAELQAADDSAAAQAAVSAQELDALVIFPEDFDAQVEAYAPSMSTYAPNVEIYHNSLSSSSDAAYSAVTLVLDNYESSLTNKFDINRAPIGADGTLDLSAPDCYDLASEKDETGSFFSMLLPMLLMIFLFSGCMSVAPESIAGEKERGTMATMLITPVSRKEIALGKIAALSAISLLSGASSAVGTILSLPKLMQGATDKIDGSVYGLQEYLLLAVVILATVLLLVTLISLISAFARTVKEAQTMVMPLMFVVMFLGITAMFGSGSSSLPYVYLIPLYNSVQCMVGIFSFQIEPIHILLTAGSNLVFVAAGIWGLTKLFRSEKIVFSK